MNAGPLSDLILIKCVELRHTKDSICPGPSPSLSSLSSLLSAFVSSAPHLSSLPPAHWIEDHLLNDGLVYANTPPFPKEASASVPMVTKTTGRVLKAETPLSSLHGVHLNVNDV